jgi:hypothetical protein
MLSVQERTVASRAGEVGSDEGVAGPKVYICGNSRTEVYHSSEDCAAMRCCTYQTLIMT